MRPKLRSVWRYRPRILTLVVFFGIAGLIVLANLSDVMTKRREADLDHFDLREPPFGKQVTAESGLGFGAARNLSYGWPLLWNQYACDTSPPLPRGIYGWYYSKSRLAANAGLWLVMTLVPALVCERQLRRSPLRLRFGLRTMLTTVALTAAFCAWFTAARRRAEIEDRFIASLTGSEAFVERWGPRWLEAIGADRFCRQIVAAHLRSGGEDDRPSLEELLCRLRNLPGLRHLIVDAHRLTPRLGAALGDLRNLELLSIQLQELTPDTGAALAAALGDKPSLRTLHFEYNGWGYDLEEERAWHGCLAVIGEARQLESLSFRVQALRSDSLGRLAGLTELKSLGIELYRWEDETATESPSPLGSLPRLARLENLELRLLNERDPDFHRLSTLPRLKSLSLDLHLSSAGFAELASLPNLEQLTISEEMASPDALDALHSARRLRKLRFSCFTPFDGAVMLDDGSHLPASEGDVSDFRRAIEELRRAIPGIRIEGDDPPGGGVQRARLAISGKYEATYGIHWFVRQCVQEYKGQSTSNRQPAPAKAGSGAF